MSKLTLKTEGDTTRRRHPALRGAARGGLSRAHGAGAHPEVAARPGRLDDAGLHQRRAPGRQDPLRVDRRQGRRVLPDRRVHRAGAVQPHRSRRAHAPAGPDARTTTSRRRSSRTATGTLMTMRMTLPDAADARGHAGDRHGARHGSELRPPRDHDLRNEIRLRRGLLKAPLQATACPSESGHWPALSRRRPDRGRKSSNQLSISRSAVRRPCRADHEHSTSRLTTAYEPGSQAVNTLLITTQIVCYSVGIISASLNIASFVRVRRIRGQRRGGRR